MAWRKPFEETVTEKNVMKDKLCYIHVTESCAATKREETLIQATVWMHLKSTVLRERQQFPNVTKHLIPFE